MREDVGASHWEVGYVFAQIGGSAGGEGGGDGDGGVDAVAATTDI